MFKIPEPIEIIFTNDEKEEIKKEALRRQKRNEERGLSGRNGGPAVGETAQLYNYIGAAGEMAVAKHLDLKEFLYQEVDAVRGSADLPPNIEIKTRSKHHYDMIVQIDDVPTKRFVMVTIENRQCLIHGWADGVDIMKKHFIEAYADRGGAYFVPKWMLKSMDSFEI